MPEFSSGSSFDLPKADRKEKHEEQAVDRPTKEEIAVRAQELNANNRGDQTAMDHFRIWSSNQHETPDLVSTRKEYYSGWTKEDFREILTLLEKGRRPDETTMKKEMDSFSNRMQSDGWTKEDILKAMDLFREREK